jgi:uncharacterized membrane protein YgaE (UPF0421/DUF939 family)
MYLLCVTMDDSIVTAIQRRAGPFSIGVIVTILCFVIFSQLFLTKVLLMKGICP